MKPYDYQHPYFLRALAERLDRKFPALSSNDPDYVFHEIAHHILLTQVQPRDSSDFRFIEEVIGEMSLAERRCTSCEHARCRSQPGIALAFSTASDEP